MMLMMIVVAESDEYFVVGSVITVILPPNALQAYTMQAKEVSNPLKHKKREILRLAPSRFSFGFVSFCCFPLFVNWSERHDKGKPPFLFVLNFFQRLNLAC